MSNNELDELFEDLGCFEHCCNSQAEDIGNTRMLKAAILAWSSRHCEQAVLEARFKEISDCILHIDDMEEHIMTRCNKLESKLNATKVNK